MQLIGATSEVVPADSSPLRQEDPFSALARAQLRRLVAEVPELREASGASPRPGAPVRLAVVFANCYGGWTFCDRQAALLAERGPRAVSSYLSIAWFPAAAQGQVTIKNRMAVRALTFSSGFHAFTDALTTAAHWLRTGVCDVVLAGAAESVGSPFLAKALGPEAVNDAAVWLALSDGSRGPGRPVLEFPAGAPPSTADVEISGPGVQGSPLEGACALPLLLLDALRQAPCVIRVPGRAVFRARNGSLEMWRQQ